jgi:amidohydrolase
MKERAYAIAELVRDYRRDFHMHPELGFHETRTSEIVASTLEELGYRVRRGVARTGVVAELGEGSPVIAIRADMDALPIQEQNDVPYASQTPGVMHACGHDAHTAIALGVATLLKDENFSGTVRFLFQPSEDSDDEEGVSGAPRMIEAGALEGVDAILGLHVGAGDTARKIKTTSGIVLAGTDLFTASVIGSGGHGGSPHTTIDPIHIAAHVILPINSIVSRRIPAFKKAVVSLGIVHGGTADTVIPEKVDLAGSIRYTDLESRETIHKELNRALSIARNFGGDYVLNIDSGSPPTINDPGMVKNVLQATEDLFGKEQIQDYSPIMAGEDFAYYARMIPACFFFVGAGIEGDLRNHHDPRFDIDESCLPIGVAVMAESALRLLR